MAGPKNRRVREGEREGSGRQSDQALGGGPGCFLHVLFAFLSKMFATQFLATFGVRFCLTPG